MACPPYIPAELSPRVGFIGSRTTNLSIPNTTITSLTLPTQTFDSDGYFTPGASLGTIPAGKAGLYAITGRGSLASSHISEHIRILAGGFAYDMGGGGAGGSPGGGITVPLAVGDTVELLIYQGTGGAINCTAARLVCLLIGL